MSLSEIANRIAHLFDRKRFDESFDEEVRLHLAARAEELETSGMHSRDALAQARREFGPTARAAEESRAAWRLTWFEDLLQDLRYATRALRRDHAFAITAIASLALGIGVNTTIFSLTAEFLFSEPSVREPATLVRAEIGGGRRPALREYRFVRDAQVFSGLAGANEMQDVNWRTQDLAQRLFATVVTENFFEVTGIPVALGRPIQTGDRQVAVISHRFWHSKLNGDANILGRSLILDGQPFSVIGVLPEVHRTLTGFGYVPDLYVPVASETMRLSLYGRIPSGVTREAVRDRLQLVSAGLDKEYADGNHKWADGVSVSKLAGVERLTGGFLRPLVSLFGILMTVVALLLLIACANVASLLLARASTRAQEFGIRMSIGAGRGRVVRQMLAESLMLSLLGATAGLALNYLLTRLMNQAVIVAPFPMRLAIQPDWRLLLYAAGVAVGCAVLAGVLPALKCARAGSNALVKRDEHQVSGRRATLRNSLVAGQLAVSVLVLVVAALSIRNLARSAKVDPAFDIHDTIWAQMRLVPANYAGAEKVRAAVSSTLDRIRALPGVVSAAAAAVVPLNDHFLSRSSVIYTGNAVQGLRVEHAWNAVGPEYFRTMGIKILTGREFNSLDREGARQVVILNESLARKAFGAGNPIGQRIRFGSDDRSGAIVIGVARNSKYSTIGEKDRPALYESYLQVGGRAMVQILVKTAGTPDSLLQPLTAEFLKADPTASLEIKPMSRALAFALMPSQIGAVLLGSIGLLGLALASVGLYGVLAYTISRRTREIGLRVALGAQRGDVITLVMRESAWIVSTGLLVGGLLALLATKPLTRFLVPGLTPADPPTYIAVASILIAVGVVASLTPAIRALRIDPNSALRYE